MMFGAALTIAALAAGPRLTPVVETRCTLIESNNVYCEQTGNVTLEQTIFADADEPGWNVVAWRIRTPHLDPYPCRGEYRCTWLDKDGTIRVVRAPLARRTWYGVDWELKAREFLPQDERRGLGGERVERSVLREAR